VERFWGDVDDYQRSPPGSNGDTTLFRLACRVREFANAGWLDLDDALDRLDRAREVRTIQNGDGQYSSDWVRILRSSLRAVGDREAERADLNDFIVDGKPISEHEVRTRPKDRPKRTPVNQSTGTLTVKGIQGIHIKRVRWLWHDRIPLGEITLIAGREGLGKSTYLADLAAKVSNGTAKGEFEGSPRSVIYMAQEDSLAYTVKPRLLAAGANQERILTVESTDEGGIVLPNDTDQLAELARINDVGVIMCDPIISLIHDDISTDRSRELRRALEPLRRAAEQADCAVVALVHFNKSDGDVLTKVSGSRGWVEVARAAMGLAKGDGELVPDDHIVLSQIKNNLGRLDLSNWTFKIVSHELPTSDGPTYVGRLEWGPKVDTNVHELLQDKRTPGRNPKVSTGVAVKIAEHCNELGHMIPAKEATEIIMEESDVSERTAFRHLKKFVAEKLISTSGGLYGAPGH
jgi:archaellum biogenesis ATPase FlaH